MIFNLIYHSDGNFCAYNEWHTSSTSTRRTSLLLKVLTIQMEFALIRAKVEYKQTRLTLSSTRLKEPD